MIEATLLLDSYGRNLMYTNDTAMIHQVYNLIVMDKGTDPLNPEKGVGITSYYYEYKDDTLLRDLENEIQNQISKYTPYSLVNVLCRAIKNKKGDYILHIFLSFTTLNKIVNVSTNGEKTELALLSM